MATETEYTEQDHDAEERKLFRMGRALARVMIQEGCMDLQDIEWAVPGWTGRMDILQGARSEWFDYIRGGETLPQWDGAEVTP